MRTAGFGEEEPPVQLRREPLVRRHEVAEEGKRGGKGARKHVRAVRLDDGVFEGTVQEAGGQIQESGNITHIVSIEKSVENSLTKGIQLI